MTTDELKLKVNSLVEWLGDMNTDDVRLRWQLRRLVLELPMVIFLIHWSIKENGWSMTYYWLKFFSVNVSILVALTKKMKWM